MILTGAHSGNFFLTFPPPPFREELWSTALPPPPQKKELGGGRHTWEGTNEMYRKETE